MYYNLFACLASPEFCATTFDTISFTRETNLPRPNSSGSLPNAWDSKQAMVSFECGYTDHDILEAWSRWTIFGVLGEERVQNLKISTYKIVNLIVLE